MLIVVLVVFVPGDSNADRRAGRFRHLLGAISTGDGHFQHGLFPV